MSSLSPLMLVARSVAVLNKGTRNVRFFSKSILSRKIRETSLTFADSNADSSDSGTSASTILSLANIIDSDDSMSHIRAHDKFGFTVNNIHMRGSVLVFKNFTMLWNVSNVVDISPRNTALIHVMRPKVDIFLIGTGDRMENINPSMYGYFQRKGISVEPMSNTHAIAQFNLLNAEGRNVAVALLSRTPVSRDEACFYTPKLHVTDSDKRFLEALSKDYSIETATKLIEGGSTSTEPLVFPTTIERKQSREPFSMKYGYPGAIHAPESYGYGVDDKIRDEKRTAKDDDENKSGLEMLQELVDEEKKIGGKKPKSFDDYLASKANGNRRSKEIIKGKPLPKRKDDDLE
jgi:uncharacterized protein